MDCGIYCIENITTHKKYIGQSNNIKERWRKHISELNHGYHDNDYLQKAWNKYGESDFKFTVLEYCNPDDLDEREVYYINEYNTTERELGYNLKTGGQNGGSIFSKESKQKLSKSIKKSYTDELREIRRRDALKQWANPEIKAKISGTNSSRYGQHLSEEARKSIGDSKRGKSSYRLINIPVLCVETQQIYKNASNAGKIEHIDSCSILKCCRGERHTCNGFHWEFVKENVG